MKQNAHRFLTLMAVIAFTLNACGSSTTTDATPDVASIATAVVQTVAAQNTQQALVDLATRVASSPTPAAIVSTPTPEQILASPAAGSTNTPISVEYKIGCVYAKFVADVSIVDNTIMAPGTVFTKTWRIANAGSCKWDSRFALVFFSGDKMGDTTSVPLPRIVYPGQEVDFSVTMTAPATYGHYSSQWRLGLPNGTAGVGPADENLTVSIEVSDKPQRDFAVTSVLYTAIVRDPYVGCNSGRVKATYTFYASITVNAPGVVTYQWARLPFDGVNEGGTLTFKEAGTKEVKWTWTMTDGTLQNIDRQVWIRTITDWDTLDFPRNLF